MIRRVLAAGGGGGLITTLLSAGWTGVVMATGALIVVLLFLGWIVSKEQRADRLATVFSAFRGRLEDPSTGAGRRGQRRLPRRHRRDGKAAAAKQD